MKHEDHAGVIKTLIVILIIMNMIFVPKVMFDITQTGIIMTESSPDGKYETIVYREKYPSSDADDEFIKVELYDKNTGKMISDFEHEIKVLFVRPNIKFTWMEEGVYIYMHTRIFHHDYSASYILPYEQQG